MISLWWEYQWFSGCCLIESLKLRVFNVFLFHDDDDSDATIGRCIGYENKIIMIIKNLCLCFGLSNNNRHHHSHRHTKNKLNGLSTFWHIVNMKPSFANQIKCKWIAKFIKMCSSYIGSPPVSFAGNSVEFEYLIWPCNDLSRTSRITVAHQSALHLPNIKSNIVNVKLLEIIFSFSFLFAMLQWAQFADNFVICFHKRIISLCFPINEPRLFDICVNLNEQRKRRFIIVVVNYMYVLMVSFLRNKPNLLKYI